ncbi:hypothetical protein N2152v2_006542 [Parachlorella kessleri]
MVDNFYNQCDPGKENLCLYGYADGTYEVAPPCEEVPPEVPEPSLGINFARDGMERAAWLQLVAVHSDSWLAAISFYNGARLDQDGRRQLFNHMNKLPTVYEVVSGRATNPDKPNPDAAQIAKRAGGGGGGPGSGVGRGGGGGGFGGIAGEPAPKRHRGGGMGGGRGRPAAPRYNPQYEEPDEDEEEEEEEEEEEDSGEEETGNSEPCPNCNRKYRKGEFWIACDSCDRWFDGICVKMTAQKAERQENWVCPLCSKGG